jgi:hypothetical protein
MDVRRLFLTLPAALLSLAFAIPAVASAATVTNTNDAGPGSLRQAIADAVSGETIVVPAGDYEIANTLEIERTMTIEGAGATQTKIHASGSGYRDIRVSGQTSLVTIAAVTISGANTAENGAGIYADKAQLILRDDAIVENVADWPGNPDGKTIVGGGVAVTSSLPPNTGSLTMIRCRVADNRVDASGEAGQGAGYALGGGVYVHNAAASIEQSTFEANKADGSGGLGASNPAQNGGEADGAGIYIEGLTTPGAIRRSTFLGNVAVALEGPGAVSGGAYGGAVWAGSEVPLAIEAVTVTGNRAIVGNGGAAGGAGLFLGSGVPGASFALTGATIVANGIQGDAGPDGGGGNLKAGSETVVSDSIIAAGVGPAGKANCSGSPTPAVSGGFNIDSLNECGFNGAGDRVNIDPKLGPLRDNGGPTATMEPEAGSPAIDQGKAFSLTTDQRGLPRPADFAAIPNATGGDGSDIGAVEPAAAPQPAATKIALGKLTRNTRRGSGRLAVTVTNPAGGTLVLTGGGLKKAHTAVRGTRASLPLAPAKAGAKRLSHSGRLKVRLRVSLLRPDGSTAATAIRTVILIKTKHKKQRRGHRRGEHTKHHR